MAKEIRLKLEVVDTETGKTVETKEINVYSCEREHFDIIFLLVKVAQLRVFTISDNERSRSQEYAKRAC